MPYIYNIPDTWANTSNSYTAIGLEVTDTGSSNDSNLVSLSRNANALFRVGKTGDIWTANVVQTLNNMGLDIVSGTANAGFTKANTANAFAYQNSLNIANLSASMTYVLPKANSPVNVGNTRPSLNANGTLWFNQDTSRFYIGYNDSNGNNMIEIGGVGYSAYNVAADSFATANAAYKRANNGTFVVTNLDDLANVSFTGNTTAILSNTYVGGIFIKNTLDVSANVAADTAKGVYVAPFGEDGSSGAWERIGDVKEIDVKDFGIKGDGVADETIQWNKMINYINTMGSKTKSLYKGFVVKAGPGLYDVSAGGIDPVLISNIKFDFNENAVFKLKLGALITLGSAADFIENVWVNGGQFYTSTSDITPVKPVRVSGATQTNPVMITTANSHGYSSGQMVKFQQIGGMTQIDQKEFLITVLSNTTFSLNNTNGIAYTAYTSGGNTWPASNATVVYARNVARLYMNDQVFYRIPHLLKVYTPSGGYASTIRLNNFYGLGHPSHNLIDIDTQNAEAAAGLYITHGGGYPYAPPANPSIIPKAVVSVSADNPAVVNVVSHGFSTGDVVKFGDLDVTTELNGNYFTITAIDTNTFSLNGVDGATITNGSNAIGKAAVLHWAWDYKTAVVSINGHWDTVVMTGGVYQHYDWLWRIRSTGSISFVFEDSVTFDYGGGGRLNLTFAGGSMSHWKVRGGWTFTMNDHFYKYTAEGSGALTSASIVDHKIGLVGGDVFNDNSGRIYDINIKDLNIIGIGRTIHGGSTLLGFQSSATKVMIDGTFQSNPNNTYGAGATSYLLPNTGIKFGASTGMSIAKGNYLYCLGNHYDMSTPTANSSRILIDNLRFDNKMPEYMKIVAPTPSGSPYTFRNTTGYRMSVAVYGGTVSSIALSYLDGTGAEVLTSSTNQTTGVFPLAPGQAIYIVYSSAPTIRAFPS